MEKLEFYDAQDDRTVEFFIIEQTKFGGENYLLVTDSHPDDENALAYILHAVGEDGGETTYEEVMDDSMLKVLSDIFGELLDDTTLI